MTNYSFISKANINENIYCQCGCNQQIKWKNSYKYIGYPKFIKNHSSRVRKGKKWEDIYKKPKPQILKISKKCLCGCGKDFISRPCEKRKYIFGHYARVQIQKGKTYEEMYGKERALQIIESFSKRQRGISIEQRFGKEYVEWRRINFIVKYMPYAGRPGKNETKILDYIEKEKNIKLERQYFVIGYFIDGFDLQNNIAYEVDEKRHRDRKERIKDQIREQKIKEKLNCTFVRIKEEEYLKKLKENQIICEV